MDPNPRYTPGIPTHVTVNGRGLPSPTRFVSPNRTEEAPPVTPVLRGFFLDKPASLGIARHRRFTQITVLNSVPLSRATSDWT